MEILCYVLFDIAPLYHCFAHTKMSCWAVLVFCILKTADALKAVEGSQRSLSIKGDHPNFKNFFPYKTVFWIKSCFEAERSVDDYRRSELSCSAIFC